MATFQVQVEDMAGTVETSVGSGSSDTTAITSWLQDGAKEVINALPANLLILCSAEETFIPKAVGSEAETLNTGKIFNVRRYDGTIDQPCRMILSSEKGRASDQHDMEYATTTDPVYYIEHSLINILPSSSSTVGKYSEVQYPTVNYGDSSIGTTAPLTGVVATAADPTVFTKASHGLETGDVVNLYGFNEMTEINEMTGTVTKLSANTFEINGVSADPGETTGGTVAKIGGFPDEAEYLVVLYAAMKAVERLSSNYNADEDPEMAQARNTQYTWLVGQYTKGLQILRGQ